MVLPRCSVNRNPDIHRTASLDRCREPYSPATYSAVKPPSFEESVRCELIRPCMEHQFFDTCSRALDILELELGNGQISTFDEVASLVISQMNNPEPVPAFSAQIFSTQCRVAQAMYDSCKVRWLLDQVRRADNPVVAAWSGEIEASHPPLADADKHRLHELSGPAHEWPQAVGGSTASSPLSATSLTRKRKRRNLQRGPRRHTHDGEVSLVTKCPHCEQTFSGALCDQKSNLNRHIEHKHPDPWKTSRYRCSECGQDCHRSDYLLNHRRYVHDLY